MHQYPFYTYPIVYPRASEKSRAALIQQHGVGGWSLEQHN